MTDDSAAEKSALLQVWPFSVQLCQFHVLQAEWRWLSANVCIGARQHLIRLFKSVMYASTDAEYAEAIETIQTAAKNDAFLTRFNKFSNRKHEWTLLYRKGLMTRNNNTNNYSETTIRVLKDIILHRTKAYNIVALVEFCVHVLEHYLQFRLLEHAHNRMTYNKLFIYKNFCNFNEILQLTQSLYTVPSSSNPNLLHTVDAQLGTCTYISGSCGGFCKHQACVVQCFNLEFPNMPAVSAQKRFELACLALGTDVPSKHFFLNFKELPVNVLGPDQAARTNDEELATTEVPSSGNLVHAETCEGSTSSYHIVPATKIDEMHEEMKRVLSLLNGKLTSNLGNRFLSSLKRIKNFNQAMNFVAAISFDRGHKRSIKVQPTSLARRRTGMKKCAKRVPAGRPVKCIKIS